MRSFTAVIVVLTITCGTLFFLFTAGRCLLILEAAEHEDLIGMVERELSLWKSSVQMRSYQSGSVILNLVLERSFVSALLLFCAASV